MKCPMCLGKGYATDEDIKEYPHRCTNCDGKGFYSVDWQKVRCEVCNGSGKRPMTNEEYLKSCNTEQLAEWMAHQSLIALLENQNNHSLRMTYPAYWVEWLKQQHQ